MLLIDFHLGFGAKVLMGFTDKVKIKTSQEMMCNDKPDETVLSKIKSISRTDQRHPSTRYHFPGVIRYVNDPRSIRAIVLP